MAADYLDKCQDVTGLAAFRGCPEVKEEVIKVFTQALTGILFAPPAGLFFCS